MEKARSGDFETALHAWESSSGASTKEEARRRAKAYTFLLRRIAEGYPASADELALELGITSRDASEVFRGLQASGMEFDEDGHLTGAALTARKTPHRISFTGKELFAWCALDALFIPGLLDEVAEVRSPCAASGDEIRLRVGPRGVETFEPSGAVISVVLPGLGCSPGETGPASPT